MMLTNLRLTIPWLTLLGLLTSSIAACSSEAGRPPPDIIIDLGRDAGTGDGCTQPSFPAEQPDLPFFFPPVFVTETGEEQRRVSPGQEIRAEVSVNGPTRQVVVELSDAWSPEQVIAREELDTTGNQTIPLFLFPAANVRGRFYMRLTLCGSNCNERQVIFDIVDPDPDDLTTGINGDYERTLIENGEVIQVDRICIRPNSILIQ